MAKVIVEDTTVVNRYWQPWARVILIGAGAGLVFWIITLLIGRYIVEPLTCREVVDAASCVGATITAGRVSAVLTAVLAIFFMVQAGVVRPVIIAAAAAIILWDLAAWTRGMFWLEALGWSVLVYALVYALFGWIVRMWNAVAAIIIAIVVLVLLQLALIVW